MTIDNWMSGFFEMELYQVLQILSRHYVSEGTCKEQIDDA